ncbi:hypothetical protein KTT_10940 [Tengunoibacter tsumagoiensis]|uniref:Uncharacterized protein n=1 Tax=Tengunoibacter tsumagoiensis TaxID=2014871 RepID=A0A401ZWH0_9CHLR|nr:hypothetical protein KTT_10940 [Tengunoibacter tsumagoiensis]
MRLGEMIVVLGIGVFETFYRFGLDQQREAIVRKELQPPVIELLPVDAEAMLPLKFRYRALLHGSLVILAPLLILDGIICFIFLLLGLVLWQRKDFGVDFVLIAFFLCFLGVVIWLIVRYYASTQWIEADEQGLTLRTWYGERTVLWNEAHLFAVHSGYAKPYGPLFTVPHVIYELSSSHKIVHWDWQPNKKSFFFARIKGSHLEYNENMQQLLQIIAARTHLPLYDLRNQVNSPKKVSDRIKRREDSSS